MFVLILWEFTDKLTDLIKIIYMHSILWFTDNYHVFFCDIHHSCVFFVCLALSFSSGRNLAIFSLFLVVQHALVVNTGQVDLSCGNLVLEEVDVILSLLNLGLSVHKVLPQKFYGLVIGVLHHHVRTQPESNLARSVRDLRFRPYVVR